MLRAHPVAIRTVPVDTGLSAPLPCCELNLEGTSKTPNAQVYPACARTLLLLQRGNKGGGKAVESAIPINFSALLFENISDKSHG